MSLLTNLSVSSQLPQYNGKINNITRPTKQIYHTNQIFFQSPTSRPFYTSHRRDGGWLVEAPLNSQKCSLYFSGIEEISTFTPFWRYYLPGGAEGRTGEVRPLTPDIDKATWAFLKFDIRHTYTA